MEGTSAGQVPSSQRHGCLCVSRTFGFQCGCIVSTPIEGSSARHLPLMCCLCEGPNPRERFFTSGTEGQPARAPSRDPTRVSGPGCLCFGASNEFDPAWDIQNGRRDVPSLCNEFQCRRPEGVCRVRISNTLWNKLRIPRGVRWADVDDDSHSEFVSEVSGTSSCACDADPECAFVSKECSCFTCSKNKCL